ncbi:MAG: Polypeptide-transport-associated domain protein ShlB-type [Moraxellaceae bacterium]|jgi:hemolysin activation/secretion protein|nr:Polypeptide-transport-associated domain protein ShlB-type [Moraxellaceae bacterium]
MRFLQSLRRPAQLGGFALVFASLPVHAESAPDAGQLLERSREPLIVHPLEQPRIEAPAGTAAAGPAKGAIIPVRAIRITGATRFSEATLHALLADAEGRSLTFAELETLAARITGFYTEQGYLLAHAYLPPQEIREGVVEVTVQEGRLEQVESDDSAGLDAQLRRRLGAALQPGQPLRRAALERAVLLHDSLPGIEAGARLRAGADPGGTVVVLQTRPGPAWSGEATLDNHGDRYTGEVQGGLRLEWQPRGSGDQLALRLQSAGEGRLYGRAAYDFDIHGPWRSTLALSSTRYELGKEFASLEADGWARTASADLRYPLLMNARLRLHALAGADAVRLVDRIGLTGSERDKNLGAGRLGLTLQTVDAWRGQSVLHAQATAGRVDIQEVAEAAFDALTAGSAGGFAKFNLLGERWQPLPGGLQLRGSASLQWAFGNLTSSQKLSISGPNGVRAYPAGEAQGDEAQLIALELRRALPVTPRWQPTALVFADYGHVAINHDTWPGFTGDNERELSAAGVGLDWQGPWGLGLTAWQAWPLKNMPVTAEPDSNHRLWLAGRLSF